MIEELKYFKGVVKNQKTYFVKPKKSKGRQEFNKDLILDGIMPVGYKYGTPRTNKRLH